MFYIHNHSEYSSKDAISKVSDIAKKCHEMGYKSFAITDHGSLASFPEAFLEAKKYGLKFAPGLEAYLKPKKDVDSMVRVQETAEAMKVLKRKTAPQELKIQAQLVLDKWAKVADKRNHHLTLIAKNQTGLENLFKIYSEAEFYYKDRISTESLFNHKEGLIVLSGCFGSELCYYVKSHQTERAENLIREYKNQFGDDYYVEIMYHSLTQFEKEKEMGFLNEIETYKELVRLAKNNGVKIVATNDSHYVEESDQKYHNLYKSICYHKTEDQKVGDDAFSGKGYHLLTEKELVDLLREGQHSDESIEEMIKSIYEIESKVDNNIDISKPPEFENKLDLLRSLVEDGWSRLRKGTEREQESRERFEYELDVISKKNFTNYFSNVYNIIKRCYDLEILHGPGRGSGAGSEINFLLGITKTDPLKYGLLFERFLNPGRNKMPDIDIDIQAAPHGFDSLGNEAVVKSLEDTYKFNGKIMNSVTGSTLVLFKKMASYFDVMFSEVNKFTTSELGKDLLASKECPKDEEFYKALRILGINIDSKWASLVSNAELCYKLDGIAFGSSVHASGVIMTEEEIALPKNSSGVINFNGSSLEKYNYCKYDLLSLDTLDPIKDIYGLDVDWEDTEDPKVWETLSTQDTQFVFQLGSSGMSKMLREGKVGSIDKLAEINAIYRPGPLGMKINDLWIQIQKGETDVLDDTNKVLASLLKEHFGERHSGLVIFQEDVMKICEAGSGFSKTEADNIREAMGKKKMDIMDSYKPKFIENWDREKYQVDPEEVWDRLKKFAEYAFNKSHSVAYSLISYQTAKLLTYNKEEYFEWMMNNGTAKRKKEILEFCKKSGYTMVFPSFSSEEVSRYKIVGDKIYAPTSETSNSKSLSDFIFSSESKVDKINLIYKGAIDRVTRHREAMAKLVKAIPNDFNSYPDFPSVNTLVELLENGKYCRLWDFKEVNNSFIVEIKKPRSSIEIEIVKENFITDDIIKFNIKQDLKHFKVCKPGTLSDYPYFKDSVIIDRIERLKQSVIRAKGYDESSQIDRELILSVLKKELEDIFKDPRFKKSISLMEEATYITLFREITTYKDYGYSKVTLEFESGKKIFYIRDKNLAAHFHAADKNSMLKVNLGVEKYINKNLQAVILFKITGVES